MRYGFHKLTRLLTFYCFPYVFHTRLVLHTLVGVDTHDIFPRELCRWPTHHKEDRCDTSPNASIATVNATFKDILCQYVYTVYTIPFFTKSSCISAIFGWYGWTMFEHSVSTSSEASLGESKSLKSWGASPACVVIFFSMGFFCPVNCNQLIFLEASCRGLRCLKVFKGKALTLVSCLGLFVMLTRRRARSKLGDVFKLSECCWLKKRAIRRFNNCNMRLCMSPHLNMEHEALKDLTWLRWIASQPCSNDVWDVLCLSGASQLRRIHGGLPSNACGALIVMQGVNRHVLWSEDFQIS